MSNMDVKIGAEMLNVQEVYSLVEELSHIEKNKAIKAGLRKGAGVFIAGGRRRLRSRMKQPHGYTGNLMRSFVNRVKKRKLGALAGFNRDWNNNKGLGFHAHLVDKGTRERYTRKGQYRGIMPANYFWTETREREGAKAIDAIREGIEQAVARMKSRH